MKLALHIIIIISGNDVTCTTVYTYDIFVAYNSYKKSEQIKLTLSLLWPSIEQSLDKKKSLWVFFVSTSHLTFDIAANSFLVYKCNIIHVFCLYLYD